MVLATFVWGRHWEGDPVLFESDNTKVVSALHACSWLEPGAMNLLRALDSWRRSFSSSSLPSTSRARSIQLPMLSLVIRLQLPFPLVHRCQYSTCWATKFPTGHPKAGKLSFSLVYSRQSLKHVQVRTDALQYLQFCQRTGISSCPSEDSQTCVCLLHTWRTNGWLVALSSVMSRQFAVCTSLGAAATFSQVHCQN